MKKITGMLAAMLIAVSACGNMLSASAADQVYYPGTVCDGFEPYAKDIITVEVPEGLPVSVEIVQHSPERENLLLYKYDAAEPGSYVFRAEPGSYTVTLTSDAVRGSAVRSSAFTVFVINDANDSVGDDAYDFTDFRIICSRKMIEDSETADVTLSEAASGLTEGVLIYSQKAEFKQYGGYRGDYDGDGDTDNADAQLVLNDYAAWVADKSFKPDQPAGRIAAADYDGDGQLTAADAQVILNFYTMTVAGQIPQWPDGIPDARNFVIGADGRVVIADEPV